MNTIQTAVIAYIRKAAAAAEKPDLTDKLTPLTDEQVARLMFANYRGKDSGTTRGLKLTRFGLTVMQRFFTGYEVAMPEGVVLHPSHLLYLDARATMPYHCCAKGFVIYDQHLGIKLKLADGRISILIEMDAD